MESFFSRFKNSLVLITVLLLQIVGLAVQVRRTTDVSAPDAHSISLMRYWVVATIAPVERFFLGFGHNLRGIWSNYADLRHVRQHNRDLEYQLAQLRIQQAAIAEDAIQGHRLQSLLAFQQHYITTTVAAQVIGTSGSDLSRILYIDKGREEGLRPDMAVITPDGVVGKLRDVFPHTAQVLLLDDQTSGAGVLLASTRIRAILRGTPNGRMQIGNLTADSRIKPGEQVLTSGGDQVYPRGLPIGTIESIAPDPDHQPYTAIQVRPAANLSQLEEVLVITGTQTDLPQQAQQDLAVGAATTEAARAAAQQAEADAAAKAAAQSAAQIVADRLPSLHDVTNPNSPESTTPTTPVPRPTPTLRPDRYTPGAAPPATSLTPGGHNPQPANIPRPTTESQPKTDSEPPPQ